MKLHLPKALAAAVLACIFADGAFAAATVTEGAITNLGRGATQSTLTDATDAKTTVDGTEYVVLNIGSLYANPGSGQGQYWSGNESISTNLQIGTSLTESSTNGLWINNGNRNQSVTFSGKIIGAGTIGKASPAPSTGMKYTFTGDLSGFTGSIKAVNSATLNVVYASTNADTTNLVANSIVASGGTVNMTVNSGATYKFTGGFDVNNLTIGSSSATFSADTVNATTATINANAKVVLADGAVLTAGTLTNNGTISFTGDSKLDTGTVYNVGQTYNFGALENVTKNNLIGLGARADISYDATTHDITVTGTIGDLIWGGGAGNLTDANWTWNDAAATFEEGDSLTISGTGSSVTISGAHTVNTMTVKNGGAVSLTHAPVTVGNLQLAGEVAISADEDSSLQVTGTASAISGQALTKLTLSGTDLTLADLGTATTFTKAGDGTLTLTGNGMIGNNGTVVVEGGTLAVTTHNQGTAALQQAAVTVKAGATLALGYDTLGWDGNRTKSITLIGSEDHVATLQHTSTSSTTFQVALNMQGYATVNGTGSFNTYRQSGDTASGIFVTNNHNTFAAELGIRGPLTINVEGGGSLDFTGKLAKNNQTGGNITRTVTKTGAGDLNISNSSNNFDGDFTVSDGTLRLVNGASATTGALAINSGATLAYSGGSIDITGSSNITFQTGSTLSVENGTHLNLKSDNLSLGNMTVGNKPTSGGLTVSVYNDAALTGKLTLSGSTASIGFINGKSLSIAGGVLTATAATNASDIQTTVDTPVSVTSTEADAGVKFTNMNVTITNSATDAYKLNSTMTGSGTLTTKGDVLIHESTTGVAAKLSGFTGGIVVESGSLKLGNGVNENGRSKGLANSLGTGTITVKNNASLSLSAQEITIGNKLVFGNSQLTLRDGQYAHNNGQNDSNTDYTFSGAVTLNGKLTIHTDCDKKETFSGLISGDGSLELTASSGQRAIVELSGNNTYSGGTNVKGGVQLKATGTNSLGTGVVTLGTTATVTQGENAEISNVLFDNFSDTKNITGLSSDATMSHVAVTVNENMTMANMELADSTVTIASGKTLTAGNNTGSLTLSGTTTIKAGENVTVSVNTNQLQDSQTGLVFATGDGEPQATLVGVDITDTGISGSGADDSSLTGATVTVNTGKTFELSGLDLTGSEISVEEGATLTLSEVTMQDSNVTADKATVNLTGSANNLTLTAASVADVKVVDGAHVLTLDINTADMTGLNLTLAQDFMLGLQIAFYTDPFDTLTIMSKDGFGNLTSVEVTPEAYFTVASKAITGDAIKVTFNGMIPEPATATLSLLALAALAARRRRKH